MNRTVLKTVILKTVVIVGIILTMSAGKLIAAENAQDYVVDSLVASGWLADSANAVYEVNSKYYSDLYDLDENVLDDELYRLKRLGMPEYQDGIRRHPEMATLLGSVLDVDTNGARNILKTLDKMEGNTSEDYTSIVNLYLIYGSTAEDASHLAKVLQNPIRREKLIQLLNQSMSNLELITYFETLYKLEKRSPDATKVFQEWLFSQFDKMLKVSPDSLEHQHANIQLLLFSSSICHDLETDVNFRKDFMRCWYVFESIVKEQMDEFKKKSFRTKEERTKACEEVWVSYHQDYDVFRFLHLYPKDGKKLYKRYGTLACIYFLNEEVLKNPNAKAQLLQMFLAANDVQSQAFAGIDISQHPRIVWHLQRGLHQGTLYKMFLTLANSNNQEGLLSYWEGCCNEEISEQYDPQDPGLKQFVPGYDVYQLTTKVIDGRSVNTSDFIFAGIDAAFIAVDVATLGSGMVVTKGLTKVMIEGGKPVLKQVGKDITKESVKKSAYQMAVVMKNATNHFSKGLVHVGKQGLDITTFTRYLYQKTGANTKQFKKFTNLDARIFMRNDRRVVVAIDKVPGKSKQLLRNVMLDTAVGLGLVTAISSETGQKFIKDAKESSSHLADSVKNSATEIDHLWKQNVSLWWIVCQKD